VTEDGRRKPVTHDVALEASVSTHAEISTRTLRGTNATRITVLLALASIGLAVGLGLSGSWWLRLLASIAAVVVAGISIAFVFRSFPVRQTTMRLMHWLSGE
jgi:hypothetical protein